jgi:catechol 2,3-dioxygenase-like lactoylglutathione lyase family enzyme
MHTALVPTRGLRHLALRVRDLGGTRDFYQEVFGMRVVWEPDADNVYLSSGSDNLALHRAEDRGEGPQTLDHLGFLVGSEQAVRTAAERLRERGVEIVHEPRQHRDGSSSLYCLDPDGNLVQILYDPNTNP